MSKAIKISKNLTILSSRPTWEPFTNELNTVHYECIFFGELCWVTINRNAIEKGWQSVSGGESPSAIHASFIEAVEEDHWDAFENIFTDYQRSQHA